MGNWLSRSGSKQHAIRHQQHSLGHVQWYTLVSACTESYKRLIGRYFSVFRRNPPLDFGMVELRDTTGKTKRIRMRETRKAQMLDDGVRVLSRAMSYSKTRTGVKIRFVD